MSEILGTNFLQGFLPAAQAGVEARNDVTVAIRNWFANRNPLVTRLPYVPVERIDYQMYTHNYRARSTSLNTTSGYSNSAGTATLTLTDASFLMMHDVLELVDNTTGNVERVQVAADPTSTTQVSVTRGLWTNIGGSITNNYNSPGAGMTISSGDNVTVYVIGNSRNGAEVNQTGLTTVGVARTNWAQTFQFPVQISGTAQTARAQVMPGGIQTPFDFNMTMQLQHMVDDIETSFYYGIGQPPNDVNGVTAKTNGLRSIFTTNNISPYTGTTPINAGAYTATDLIRDTLQACRTGGGEPDVMLVSTNFMSAFATWGQALMRVPAGETAFGTPISVLEAPFLNGVTIIEAPLLRPYTAICLTSGEVYVRNKRNPYWQQRGIRGDMIEGDWLAELGIEVVNESHHAWVEGITAFSAN